MRALDSDVVYSGMSMRDAKPRPENHFRSNLQALIA